MTIATCEYFNGDVGIVDKSDDNEPLLKVSFHNDFKNIPKELKNKICEFAFKEIIEWCNKENKAQENETH